MRLDVRDPTLELELELRDARGRFVRFPRGTVQGEDGPVVLRVRVGKVRVVRRVLLFLVLVVLLLTLGARDGGVGPFLVGGSPGGGRLGFAFGQGGRFGFLDLRDRLWFVGVVLSIDNPRRSNRKRAGEKRK